MVDRAPCPGGTSNRSAPQSGQRRIQYLVAALLLTGAVCWLFLFEVRKQGFHASVFWASLRALDWRWLTLSIVFSYATYAGRALRWAVLLKPLRPHPSFSSLLSATIIGFSATAILGRAGELVRPYLIANQEDVSFSSQIAAWVVERIYDVLVALAVFGFALSQVRGLGLQLGKALSWTLQVGGFAVGVLAAVCLAALVAMSYFSEHLQGWLMKALSFLSEHHLGRVERVATAFLDGVRATRSQSVTARLILYTIGEWLLIAICYGFLLHAFGPAVDLGWIDILIFMGFVSFGSLVQLPGVGGGVQVTAMLVLTEIFGVPIEIAASLALLVWAITFVAIVPVGLVLALRKGISWTRIRDARFERASSLGEVV